MQIFRCLQFAFSKQFSMFWTKEHIPPFLINQPLDF